MTEVRTPDTLALARHFADLIRERRGTDIVLLDVRALVDYTDFFLLLTGRSTRQNQAIADHIVRTLKTGGTYAISKAGLETGTWICIDLGDIVVHVFDPATRDRYDLELLWADAVRIDLDAPEPEPVPVAPPATAEKAPKESKKRRRPVRAAAVEDADASNAPDAERPPDDEPGPPEPPALKKKTPKTPMKAKPAAKKAPAKKPARRSKKTS